MKIEIDLDNLESLDVRDSLLRKLQGVDDDKDVDVNIKMHALQWKRLLAIRYYRLHVKGDRRAHSLTGTLYPLIDRAYAGVMAAIGEKAKKEEPEPEPEPDPEDDLEGLPEPEDDYEEEGDVGFHVHRPRKV